MPGVTLLKGTQLFQGYKYLGKFDQVCLYHPRGGLWKEEGDKQIPWLRAVLELGVTLIRVCEMLSISSWGVFNSL